MDSIEFGEHGHVLSTHVIGLFGSSGLLPHVDKDLVDGRESNETLRDFLDVFNGRIIELLSEAWKKNRPSYRYELAKIKAGEVDECLMMSLAISGIEAASQSSTVTTDAYVPSTGLLCRRVITASGIERFLASQFTFHVSVKEFCKSKLHLRRNSLSRLSQTSDLNNRLGSTAMLGSSNDSYSQRFEIKIGPLNKNEFQSMCPYGEHRAFSRFVELVKTVMSRPLDFDVRLVVQPDAMSQARLQSNSHEATRLGFDSWLCSHPSSETNQDSLKRFYWDKN